MYPSPFMTCLLIVGIIFLTVAPPLGMILIALGILEQRRLGRRLHRSRRAARCRSVDDGLRYFR